MNEQKNDTNFNSAETLIAHLKINVRVASMLFHYARKALIGQLSEIIRQFGQWQSIFCTVYTMTNDNFFLK